MNTNTEIDNFINIFNEININPIPIIKNRGIGAGGANTTLNGLSFEKKTSIENKLLENGSIDKLCLTIDTFSKNLRFFRERIS
jgi:hypothetical protein